MKRSDEKNAQGGGYGYYGGYYYGEGYGDSYGDSGATPSRGIKDYLIILRERIWWLVSTVFVIFLGVALYTFNAPELYLAGAKIEILRNTEEITQFQDVQDQAIRGTEDIQTQINILESQKIVQRVEERVQGKLRRELMAPYEEGIDVTLRGVQSPMSVIYNGRSIKPDRMSLTVNVLFSHPNPSVAAEVANLFANEFIDYNRNKQMEVSLSAMDDLRQKVREQGEKVNEMELRIADFKEEYGTVAIESSQDIDNQGLVQLKSMATIAKQDYDEKKTLYNQVLKAQEAGIPLYEITWISEDSRVQMLQNALSSHKIERASLSKKYGPKHPSMIAAQESIDQTLLELNLAIENKRIGITNEYKRAESNYLLAEQRLREQENEIIRLDRLRPKYNALSRDLEVSKQLYNHLYGRYNQTAALVSSETSNARIIDEAVAPMRPYKPNIVMNLGIGLVLGFGMGFGLVFLLAILDDKVKTAFDIENSIGLPLVGIVPRISIVDSLEKARIVADNLDKHSVEAFRAIHSTMKLNEESRNAKVILTTSTIPSEGKSFVSTNMAFTFAAHGEKTIVIDADLRMPNVGKSLGISNQQGIIQVLDGTAKLDDVIIKNHSPGMDVLVTGGRSKNPTQMLSSERFEGLIHELRMRYDKVLIDSPPLAPVSDALNILPLVDGIVYVIRFNMVKRKTAAINVKRLRESNVPIFGAILNNINTSVAGYYYSHYYDNSYKHYYLQASEEESETVKS